MKIKALFTSDVLYVFDVIFSRELLTPQQHYDWGLRALKTILRGCGTLLQKLKKNLEEGSMWQTPVCQ